VRYGHYSGRWASKDKEWVELYLHSLMPSQHQQRQLYLYIETNVYYEEVELDELRVDKNFSTMAELGTWSHCA
jgi:hypothetical protein